jgi:cell division transport system permease protein
VRGSSFRYLFKQGLSNVWINRLMSLASIFILTACFILVGGAVLLGVNLTGVFKEIEDQNEMVVYLYDDISDTDRAMIQSTLEDLDGVASVRYVSKDEALEEQKAQLGEDASLLEGLESDNPLPASFRVKLSDLAKLSEVQSVAESLSGVESISAPTYIAETLTGLRRIFLILGGAIILVLLLASGVVISNTIKLTVNARRREIAIMKYVGATNSFIRLPFKVEGTVIGFIAAILSFFVLYGVYAGIQRLIGESSIPWLSSISGGIVSFSDLWYWFLIGFLAAGFIIGTLGSASSMRKYLRV